MKIEIKINPTVDQIAEAFCELSDDGMARFFEACGQIMRKWDAPADIQLHAAGRHMRKCSCVTYEGRRVVEQIYMAMTKEPS